MGTREDHEGDHNGVGACVETMMRLVGPKRRLERGGGQQQQTEEKKKKAVCIYIAIQSREYKGDD